MTDVLSSLRFIWKEVTQKSEGSIDVGCDVGVEEASGKEGTGFDMFFGGIGVFVYLGEADVGGPEEKTERSGSGEHACIMIVS